MVSDLCTELDCALITIGYVPGETEFVGLIVTTTVWLELMLFAEKFTETPEGTPLAENVVTSLNPEKTWYETSITLFDGAHNTCDVCAAGTEIVNVGLVGAPIVKLVLEIS